MTCGKVLEKCPNDCTAFIQRKNMDKHLKFCVIRDSTSPKGGKDSIFLNERLKSMEEDLSYLRKELNEEIKMRYELISDLGQLKKRNQVRIILRPNKFLIKFSHRSLTSGR